MHCLLFGFVIGSGMLFESILRLVHRDIVVIMMQSLVVLRLLALAQSDITCSKLRNARLHVMPDQYPIVVARNKWLNDMLEVPLNCLLRDAKDPTVITTEPDFYQKVHTLSSYTVMFIDELDAGAFEILVSFFQSFTRGIIVCTEELLHDIIYQSMGYRSYAVVYLVYARGFASTIYYNPHKKTLTRFDNLTGDPLLEATNDLSGFVLTAQAGFPLMVEFLELVASRTNATTQRKESERSEFKIFIHEMAITDQFINHQKIVYLHQSEKDFVLVPRLNKPIPSIHVLTDPFDLPTWLMILAVLLSLATLRTALETRPTVVQFLQNLRNILGSITVGSPVPPHRETERWLNGLLLLLSVVVINAYQSMIISYLACPRFYPELDTLDRLNESCCWDGDEQASIFRHYNACSEPGLYAILYDSDDLGISRIHGMSFCTLVSSWVKAIVDTNPPRTMTSGMYRWSRQTLNDCPLLGWVRGDSAIFERIRTMAAVFFAEGQLSRVFESDVVEIRPQDGGASFGDSTSVDELGLVWIVYAMGVGAGICAFAVERVFEMARKTQ